MPNEPRTSTQTRHSRQVALAVGSAVHRALEDLDLDKEPETALDEQRRRLPAYLAAVADPGDIPKALEESHRLLDDLSGSRLLLRLGELSVHVLARELPVLLPPAGDEDYEAGGDEDGAGATNPVGFVAGAVDLLYRDPRSGEPVVADFKTDEVEDSEDLERRAAAYAKQGEVYLRAVRDALALKDLPRFELWFLRADRIIEVEPP